MDNRKKLSDEIERDWDSDNYEVFPDQREVSFQGRFTEDLFMVTFNGQDDPMKTFKSQKKILKNHTTEVSRFLDWS